MSTISHCVAKNNVSDQGSATTRAANDNKTIILLSSQGGALSFFGWSERNKIKILLRLKQMCAIIEVNTQNNGLEARL